MDANIASVFAESLAALLARRDLSEAQMRAVISDMVAGFWSEAEIAALLITLRIKGETATEIAAAARVLREHMIPFVTGRDGVLDTCGTGGDGAGTFNISTATAIVVAAAGVPVVKHGNRASSSKSGSADVLACLGVSIEGDAAMARRCLDDCGLAFCFAQQFHPTLRHVGPVRRKLGVRTLFNCIGPLVNPANAEHQLLGVGWRELLDPVAGAIAKLGTRRALLVCGHDGLDEVTLTGATEVRDVQEGCISTLQWTPADFGLEQCTLDQLHVNSPEESAARIQEVLDNRPGPALRMVLANAAAALFAAEKVGELREGVERARTAIASGRARRVLERLVACSSSNSD